MSSTNSNQADSKGTHQTDSNHQTPYQHHRSSSIFSSIISLAIPSSNQTQNNMNNTSPTTSSSSSIFGSPNLLTTNGNYSPTSSINPNSPHSSMKDAEISSYYHHQNQNQRRSSISGFGSLTNGFRWPTGSNTSNPIPIPNANSPQSEIPSADQVMGSSLPNRKVSGGSSFRRPFELPHYSSVTEEDEPPSNTRRGRSGSLFSSFGSNPTRNTEPEGQKPPSRPRRKLSPMGERMLRDHPF